MGQRAAILATLAKSANASVERVLDQALRFDAPADGAALGHVLLQRNRRRGWIAMIKNFDRLGEDLQCQLIERPRELFGPLAETIEETSGAARANVIGIVQRAADARLVYLLAEALMDARAEVRQLAGQTLLEAISKWRLQGHLSPTAPPTERESLQRAVDFALTHFKKHRQNPALHAAFVFETRIDSPLWHATAEQHAEVTRAGNTILRAPDDPLLAPALLLALATPLKPAAIHGISSAESPDGGRSLAAQSFRLLDPLLAAAAQGITHIKALASPKRGVPWNQDNWLDYLRLIELSGLQTGHKLAWFSRMLDSSDATPLQKIMTLRAVAALGMPECIEVLALYVSDADERVARVAARFLHSRRRTDGRAYVTALAASPHVGVRQMVSQGAAPGAARPTGTRFEKMWGDYSRLPPAMQVTSARTLAGSDAQFPAHLRVKLASAQHAEALQGLRVLSTLADVRPYRAEIVALCASPDARLSSGAVKLVGRLADPDLLDLLEAAAAHADPRVRANAIEAMQDLKVANRSRQVLAMLNSRFNRERANAIKAISEFDFNTARETLAKMLVDANPLHRVSALWVVEQLNILDLVRQVTTLARRDSNPHVRGRAAEMLQRVNGSVHANA